MTWEAHPIDPAEVTAEYLYDLDKRHRLVLHDLVDVPGYYQDKADKSIAMEIRNGTDEVIADVIISNIGDMKQAVLTLVPCPKYFAPGEDFAELIDGALAPVLDTLITKKDLRRVNSFVPKSRHRTCKALIACGFKKEGVPRKAVRLLNKPAEDVVIMGYLPGKG